MDPCNQGTIYIGEWTEGIFKTSDYGKTWLNISKGLPFHAAKVAALVDINTDAGCVPA
jgi:hypothetical protein